jgi:peptide/nickel transport system permease protein
MASDRTPQRRSGGLRLAAGLGMVAALAMVALLGPLAAPHDPETMNLLIRLAPPDAGYPLGTDQLGRCVLSRLLFAARISLGWTLLSTAVIAALGTTVGLAAAAAGGWTDQALMRIVDVFLAFPTLVLTLAVVGFLGPSLAAAVLGVILAWWASYARFVRGIAAGALERDFVAASRLVGTPPWRVLLRHVLPQIAPPLMVLVSLDFGGVLLTLSTLGFLGLGVQAPTPEWGAMLAEARHYILQAPHLLWVPGAATAVAVLAFNLTGDGLRDRLGLHGTRPQ